MNVAELIEILQKIPSNKPVVIQDANTNWLLNLNTVTDTKNYVQLGGTYRDEYDGERD